MQRLAAEGKVEEVLPKTAGRAGRKSEASSFSSFSSGAGGGKTASSAGKRKDGMFLFLSFVLIFFWLESVLALNGMGMPTMTFVEIDCSCHIRPRNQTLHHQTLHQTFHHKHHQSSSSPPHQG
jgi:hypothetical protein